MWASLVLVKPKSILSFIRPSIELPVCRSHRKLNLIAEERKNKKHQQSLQRSIRNIRYLKNWTLIWANIGNSYMSIIFIIFICVKVTFSRVTWWKDLLTMTNVNSHTNTMTHSTSDHRPRKKTFVMASKINSGLLHAAKVRCKQTQWHWAASTKVMWHNCWWRKVGSTFHSKSLMNYQWVQLVGKWGDSKCV